MVDILTPEPKTIQVTYLEVHFNGGGQTFVLYPEDTLTEHYDTRTIHIEIIGQEIGNGYTRVAEDIVIQLQHVLWISRMTRTVELPAEATDAPATTAA